MGLLDMLLSKKAEKLIIYYAIVYLDDLYKKLKEVIMFNMTIDLTKTNEINHLYFESILKDVYTVIETNNAKAGVRFKLAFENPTLTGYELNANELSPGTIYCFAYYALTGKISTPNIPVKLNHLIYSYIDQVMIKLDADLEEV